MTTPNSNKSAAREAGHKANARITKFVNADNKVCFCVSVTNEGMIPHPDEGRVLGHYNNAKDAQLRASVYNHEGI